MSDSSLTILIPTYARTAWLQEALWCAIHQRRPARIIVLNDCPRQHFICGHPLVTIVNLSQRFATLGAKRNALLRLAESEWVAWLDDDDWLLPWYVEDFEKVISRDLYGVFASQCWSAWGSAHEGEVKWQRGSAVQPMAVRLQAALESGGFPEDIDSGEDKVFRAGLIARGRVCTLATVSGYCYHWDNRIYHTSGYNDPLSGAGLGHDAEYRLNHGIEPSGRIVLSPSLRHDYFKNFPERGCFVSYFSDSTLPQEPPLQRIISLANQKIKILFPPLVEEIIDHLFGDHKQGQECEETPTFLVKFDPKTGKYSILCSGIAENAGVVFHDLGQQLLLSLHNFIRTTYTAGLAVSAGAIAKGDKAILLPGSSGAGKSFLTAWLLGKSFSYLADTLVCIEGEEFQALGLTHPLSFRKSAVQDLEALLDIEQHRAETIEGSTTELVPSPLFSGDGSTTSDTSVALLVFPEFRSGAALSIEALSPAQAALLLVANVVNNRRLPGLGLPLVSKVCKCVPALRLIYGEFNQLPGVLDRLMSIILDYKMTPIEVVTLTSPFNRARHLDELAQRSANGASAALKAGQSVSGSTVATYSVPEATPKGPPKKLTIGMATYDDYDGVYFSIQALRLYHKEILHDVEILVVDNHPDGPCAAALKKLDVTIPGYRYVPEQGMTGTTVKEIVFREACGEFILCIDCHVLIVPGALQRLMEYLDAHPGCRDLLQGPLVKDDLVKIFTHFQPVWRTGMYGIWATDERGLDINAEPFDIPMQGAGLFCCHRDAWPGFNPRFRGFGGEEGYLHEKFRQNGGRTLCLPFLRWLHRFERPLGIPYEIRWHDRIRNYMIGFLELGLETQPIKDHFGEYLGQDGTLRICEDIKNEMLSPFFFFDAIYCITSDTAAARWEGLLSRLRELGIADRIRIFNAVTTSENHQVGRALSHRAIIVQAQRLHLQNILVLEDDVNFLDDTERHLADSIKELGEQDWNIFYLGGHTSGKTSPLVPKCSFLGCPEGLTCTYALAYSSGVYAALLAELPEIPETMATWITENGAIGQYLSTLDKLFVAAPSVAS